MLHIFHAFRNTLHSQIVRHADNMFHHRSLPLIGLHVFVPQKALIDLQHFKWHIADQAQR